MTTDKKDKNKMTISTCLVLKNEGRTIYRALESVANVTDEYIIGIDKTTTDNTREEVDRFFSESATVTCSVYDYDFKDSFSEARNE